MLPKTLPPAFLAPIIVSWVEACGRLDGSHVYLGGTCGLQGCPGDKADTLQDSDQQEAGGREAYGFLPGRKLQLEKTQCQTEGGLTTGGRFTTARLWLPLNSV